MNDFLYYITAYNMNFPEKKNMYIKAQLGTVINLLKNNPGFDIPLLDNHAITLQLLIKFIFQNDYTEKDEFEFQKFIVRLVSNIIFYITDTYSDPRLLTNRINNPKYRKYFFDKYVYDDKFRRINDIMNNAVSYAITYQIKCSISKRSASSS